MENWTTIMTFTYPHEAHIAKTILESEGIAVFIKDEFTVQVNNFYSNAIGGVKLQVGESDLEKSLQLLTETGYIRHGEPSENDLIEEISEIFPRRFSAVCPYCNSENVRKTKKPGYIIVLSILLLGIPLPFFRKNVHCFDCAKEWQIK